MFGLLKNRPDGTLLDKVHPYRTMMSHLMPTRNESVVYFDDYVLAENLIEYLDQANNRFDCDITHALLGAATAAFSINPKMNMFTVGRRLYQRKGVYLTFSMKRKRLNREAKISAVKMEVEPGQESFKELCDKVNSKINVERSGKKTYTDKELDLFLKIPRTVLDFAVKALKTADYYNLLPGAFIKGDPMYTSMFIANLGSLNMRAGFHHLYEWGTCPLFMMVGRIEDKPWVVDGEIQVRKVLHIRWSYDERIDDGLTANKGILGVNKVLSDPHRYLGCLEESDDHPLTMNEDDLDDHAAKPRLVKSA